MSRVLVINLARLGDIIQSSPLLHGLKEQDPGGEVWLMVPDSFVEVAEAVPGVDRVVALPMTEVVAPMLLGRALALDVWKRLRELILDLRTQRFDRIINITHSDYSAVLTALFGTVGYQDGGAPEVTGYTLDREGTRAVRGAWSNYYFNSCLNRAFNRFNLVDIHARIGGVPPGGRLQLRVDEVDEKRIDDLLTGLGVSGRRLVALVPAASTREKQWDAELWAEMAAKLCAEEDVTLVIVGAGKEFELGEEIIRRTGLRTRPMQPKSVLIRSNPPLLPPYFVGGEDKVSPYFAGEEEETPPLIPPREPGGSNQNALPPINLCGKTNIKGLAALLKRCDLCITNDTGPMHVAAAVGTRVLDISLGSALSHETAPYGTGNIVVEARMGCYPCLPKFRCPHKSCHAHIRPELVAELARGMLGDVLPDRFEDSSTLSGVNIYRTGFDTDGWWMLTPLNKRPMTEDDLVNQAYREIWKRALDGKSIQIEPQRHRDTEIRDFSSLSLCVSVVNLALEGLRIAEELAGMGDGNGNPRRAKELGTKLRELDLKLYRIGYEHPSLNPLIAQFSYGKDNLTGSRLDELATQTVQLYRELAERAQALPGWMDKLISAECGVRSAEYA